MLSGIRVLDFTWKTVGPWAPRLLTHYGAEVIHVERAGGFDDHRFAVHRSLTVDDETPNYVQGGKKLYTDPYFNTLHHGKLAISLNTRKPEGIKIVEKLIAKCDAIVENFSAEVFPNWGLTWERIREINPKIVYMSSSGFGHTGEWRGFRSFGPTAAAQSGLTLASGLPGQPPAGWGYSYLDVMGGWMGGLGLMQALMQAKKTGKGMYLDYSVTEGAMTMVGTFLLDYQVNGRGTRRPDFPPGNRADFPIGGAAQHLSLFGQRPRRAALVGVHRVRNAGAVRVTVRADGPAATATRSEVRHQ